MTAATTYEIGATLETMSSLPTLGIPGVQSTFYDWAKEATLGDGTLRGLGLPQAEWYCGYLTSDQFDTIRTICAGASANVYIATLNNEREYVRYSAVMIIPANYEIRVDMPQKFTIKFTHLAEAE